MKEAFIKFVVIELLIMGVVLILTKSDFSFETSGTKLLTQELDSKTTNLSVDQHYELNHPLRYRINIENEASTLNATLLWPQEPFTRYLILVPGQDEALNVQQVFRGRLVRCMQRCTVNNMFIDMFEFVKVIENKYPAYKGKYNHLPSMIFDARAEPGGWHAYFIKSRIFWSAYAVCLTLGGFFLFRAIINRDDV